MNNNPSAIAAALIWFFTSKSPDRYQKIVIWIARVAFLIAVGAAWVVLFYGDDTAANIWTQWATKILVGFGGLGFLCVIASGIHENTKSTATLDGYDGRRSLRHAGIFFAVVAGVILVPGAVLIVIALLSR